MYQITRVETMADRISVVSHEFLPLAEGGMHKTGEIHRTEVSKTAADDELVVISPCIGGDPTASPPIPCEAQTVSVAEVRAFNNF